MKKIILISILSIFLIQCSTVPISGRKRINIYKDADILPSSFAQYKGFLEKNKLSTNKEKSNKIKEIGARISKSVDKFMRANSMQSEANMYQWEFNLVEDATINAWCLPGGKVVFYTGILPICKNDDGIAVVMGHEIAHAFAKHGQERMTTGAFQQFGGIAVALATNQEDRKTQEIWSLAYGLSSTVGTLAFSRTHETEADKLGLVFMLMAGYNGEEAPELWVRMSEKSGGDSTPTILRTHPTNQNRIKTLKEFLPEAKRLAIKYNSVTN